MCENFADSFSVRNAFTAFSEAPRALAKPSDLSTEAIRAKVEAKEAIAPLLNKPQVIPAKEGNGAGAFEGVKANELYGQIALFMREMHDRGVYFRDLSAGNLLFRFRGDKTIEFALIDTARALFYDKSISLRQRLCDLMRICHPLCWKGRKIFLAKYMAFIGWHYRAWMNIAFYYYDLKHLIKGKFRAATHL